MPCAYAEAQLRNVLKTVCHATFYNTRTWIDEGLGVYVGWTALKHSFSDGVWYRDHLHDYARQMLLDKRSLARPYLVRAGVERVVNSQLNGDSNYTTKIHRLQR